jgi:hypothetical protein
MPKYIKLFNQFSEFIRLTADSMQDSYERKLVNIIINRFDDIADTGTGHGRRAYLIDSLILNEGKSVSDVLPLFEDKAKPDSFPLRTLEAIEVEDFRGFTKKEIIPFNKSYTFVYGPNGSGKSSLCEALEFTLLGYINEAINRRIDIDQYILNGFTGRAKKPILIGVDADGKQIVMQPDSTLYQFCFVEKNRIEDFGRISANTPNDKRNLLSSLFGLYEFNEFVGNFTRNIEKYIDVIGQAQIELKIKSSGIKVQQENIAAAKERLLELERQKKVLVATTSIAPDFDALDKLIHGADGDDGRLAEINKKCAMQAPTEILMATIPDLDSVLAKLETDVNHVKCLHEEYERNRDKVQFRDLYAAAVNLEALFINKCPVCETPIAQTAKHPFEHARDKLKELEAIVKLETDISRSVTTLHSKLGSFIKALEGRNKASEAVKQEFKYLEYTPRIIDNRPSGIPNIAADVEIVLNWWKSSEEANRRLDQRVAKHNEEVRILLTERIRIEEERKMLVASSERIREIRAKWSIEEQNVKVWEKEVNEFKDKNATLIKRADTEKVTIEENTKFVKAYYSVLSKLSKYNDELPLRNLKELNSLTCDIYNIINDGDRHYEKVARIELPSSIEDPIHIAFSDAPGKILDALHVLSEGHIRCLGLSILLAKNIREGCPFVIFDDVVNAIDDDHRAGVRNVIFSNDHMCRKQVILTTHAEQFVKELEQHISKSDYDKLVNKMSFYVDLQDRLIRIKLNAQQNYLYKIESACMSAEWSDALYNARCCLESLSHKLWKKLSNMDLKTEFSVVIRNPNGVPDLMSLVESMNKFLRKIDVGTYKKINTLFDYFIGLKTVNNVIWQYLNKGTHEEEGRIEFDPTIVKEIFIKLCELDASVKAVK